MKNLKRKTIKIIGLALFMVSLNYACNKKPATLESVKESETSFQTETQIGLVSFPNSRIKSLSEIETSLNDSYIVSNSAQKPTLLQRIAKWIKVHSGNHLFENCTYDMPCGPCPGMCMTLGRSTVITTDSTYNAIDHGNGIGTIGLMRIDSTKFRLRFVNNAEFVINNVFYVPADIELGDSLATLYQSTKFIIKQGVYPLSYITYANGETVVDVKFD
jgi:hypothetical protein